MSKKRHNNFIKIQLVYLPKENWGGTLYQTKNSSESKKNNRQYQKEEKVVIVQNVAKNRSNLRL